MVTDSIRERRQDDSTDNHRRDRAQVILIGAITLAFIVLGVVVVFNGVLYTETLSSADTGQTASGADATELEISQGVACLVAADDDDGGGLISDDEPVSFGVLTDDEIDEEIEQYESLYRNATANSRPAVIDVERESDGFAADFFSDGANVSIAYDSGDHNYDRTLTVTPRDCPRSPTIEEWNVTPENEDENEYLVEWTVSSKHTDLSSVNTTLVSDDDEVIAQNTTEFDDEREASGQHTLKPDEDDQDKSVSHVRITVRNEANYVATEIEPLD